MTQEQRKMIDIEKILQDNYNPWTVNHHDDPCYTIQIVKDIVREAIQQALELAAENAKVEMLEVGAVSEIQVNKQSIISVKELVK